MKHAFLALLTGASLFAAGAAQAADAKTAEDLAKLHDGWRLSRWYSASPASAQPLAEPLPVWTINFRTFFLTFPLSHMSIMFLAFQWEESANASQS